MLLCFLKIVHLQNSIGAYAVSSALYPSKKKKGKEKKKINNTNQF